MVPTTDWHALESDVKRSIRYHMARVRFFQSWEVSLRFVSLISGSSVVVAILAGAPDWVGLTAGALVAVAQAAELIGELGAKARRHSTLANEFSAIDQDMALRGDQVELAVYRQTQARILAIDAREPPIKRYLDLLCHNQIAHSIGSRDVYVVNWWHRLLAHYLSGEGMTPVRVKT